MREDFAVFILSHGRPEEVRTLKTLQKEGYSGKYFFILDNADSKISEYERLFGKEHVVIFDKKKVAKEFDLCDNFDNDKVVVYARNVCFDIARELNLKYFLELEDDYVRFELREAKDNRLLTYELKNIDKIFEEMLQYLVDSDALTIAFAQGGDLIGGVGSSLWKAKVRRKAMNSFFCRVDRPFTFIGRMNDDVNTYTTLGSRGSLFLTIRDIDLIQLPTQSHEGGNSDIYLEYGTYVKSFYSVMLMPSCVCIDMMGASHMRIHHQIEWENCVPKIISESFKK